MRILIDQDNVLYDIDHIWQQLHNDEYPDHVVDLSAITQWDRSQECKNNNCAGNLYHYLDNPRVWQEGLVIADSQAITKQWIDQGHELGIVTKCSLPDAMPLKVTWLRQHFPHIKNITLVTTDHKHWLDADVLIDDGLHNLEHFKGVSLLFDQPWNRGNNTFPRVNNWQHGDRIIQRIAELMNTLPKPIYSGKYIHTIRLMTHKYAQSIIRDEIQAGIL